MEIVTLKYDITFNLATGLSVNSKKWKNTKISWHEFLSKIAQPVVTKEKYTDFIKAPKAEQSKIKDVGGFVGGFLVNGLRKKSNILNRQLIALDIDFSNSSLWWNFTLLYDCAAAIHSTHKSCSKKPRHRLLIPLAREVSAEEYQAITRFIANELNIDAFDPTTFDPNRLMFWPSISVDSEYYFKYQDGPILEPDDILAKYTNWHNTIEWPKVSNFEDIIANEITKQEDPTIKKGLVGSFCRTYTIQEAIDTYLSDDYERVSNDRYTYKKGSTLGGLVIYNDIFAYSHHGTDPASNRLCNAFDLVRIHKFGYTDSEYSKKELKSSELKSFKLMEELVANDPKVKRVIATERLSSATYDFADTKSLLTAEAKKELTWTEQLSVTSKGVYDNTAPNINLIFQNDNILKNVFKLNVFDNKKYVTRSLPWHILQGSYDTLRDSDYSGIRNYIECVYGVVSSQKIDDALALEFEKARFHPVIDYLKGLVWDGKNRIETLLIDYFGAEDNIYTREAIKKMLCAAVARVMEPGIKFDLVLILSGPQGSYKSTFVKKLGYKWFSDTFTTAQGKEAFEQIQGAWIIEIAELAGLRKSEVETIKHFIAKQEDSFRPAYGRVVETYKRQCVFFGTTNSKDFLRDPTGNRRFMPIDVRLPYITKSVISDLTQAEIDQIWAEAYVLYKKGEPLYLQEDSEKIAKLAQKEHSETDDRVGLIENYLEKEYPADWDKKGLFERRQWLEDPLSKKGTTKKQYTCVAEIWCECLGKEKDGMSRYNTREINDILKTLDSWEFVVSTKNFPIYGKQRYYKRKES